MGRVREQCCNAAMRVLTHPFCFRLAVRTTQAEGDACAATVVGAAGAAQPAVAGPAAATPPPKSKLQKDPTKWSADQVQQWFAEHNEGQWSQYAGKFAGLKGEQLCELSKKDIQDEVSGLHGAAIFNDIAKLKKQTSSSSESSPGSAAGAAAALTAPLAPCFGCAPC